MARPTDYSIELGEVLCSRIAEGESVRKIVRDEGMPSLSSVFRWLRLYPEFQKLYVLAKEIQAEYFAEELMDIADDGTNDWMQVNRGGEKSWVENGESIRRSALRVDTRKWVASKLLAKKYGDKLQHTGEGGSGPIRFEITRVGARTSDV